MTDRLTTGSIAAYGALAMPLAFAGIPLYLLAPDFYATEHGVSLGLLGGLLLLLRVIDAVQDPIIGRISDRFAAHRGAILILAILGLVVGFALVFHRPTWVWAPLWFGLSVLIATTCFSVVSINLTALGGLWPKTEAMRTRVSAIREGLGIFGLLLAVSLPSLLAPYMSKQASFQILCLALAGIAGITGLIFWRWWRGTRHTLTSTNTTTTPKTDIPLQIKSFYLIVGLSILASSIPAILVVFFVRDLLGAGESTGAFLGLYFLSAILGLPLWTSLSRRIGKTRAWLASMVLAVFVFSWAFLLGAGDTWAFGMICLLSGIAFGADLSLPPARLGDLVSQNNVTSGASWLFGIYAFLGKAALAVASGLVLPILDFAGFQPDAVNSDSSLMALSIAYAAVPCGLKIFSAILLYRTLDIEDRLA